MARTAKRGIGLRAHQFLERRMNSVTAGRGGGEKARYTGEVFTRSPRPCLDQHITPRKGDRPFGRQRRPENNVRVGGLVRGERPLGHEGNAPEGFDHAREASLLRVEDYIHRDHALCAQSARHSHGQRTEEGAVEIAVPADQRRGENDRDAGGGLDRLPRVAGVEDLEARALGLHGNSGETNRELLYRAISRKTVDELVYPAPTDDPETRDLRVAKHFHADRLGGFGEPLIV